MNYYDISVSRRFFVRKHLKAIDHFWSDDAKRLTVITSEGESFSFGGMEARQVWLGANYRPFKEAKERLTIAQDDGPAYEAEMVADEPVEGPDIWETMS